MIPKRVLFGAMGDDCLLVTGDTTTEVREGLGKLRKGDAVYCDSETLHACAGIVAELGGFVVGSPGVTNAISCKGVSFLPYDCWGATCPQDIEDRAVDCIRAGVKWHSTAGTTVANMVPSRRSLPSRWRGFAGGAIHAGPILHTRGGCEYGIHIDRSEAYLQSLHSPMPADLGWRLRGNLPLFRAFSNPLAFLHCEVAVRETDRVADIPPLPVKGPVGGDIYPVGVFSGVGPSYLVERAVESGEAVLLKVHDAIVPKGTTMLWRDVADTVAAMPKRTRKPLYTRIWGKVASRGGMIGTVERRSGTRESGGLWWGSSAAPLWEPAMPRYYRPDVAAHITGRNLDTMIRAARSLESGSLVAIHVDSIWTSDIPGASRLLAGGGWREEGRGRIRYPGTGRYVVHSERGTYYGHSGHEVEPASEHELVEGSQTPRGPARGWYSDPSEDIDARSCPPDIELAGAKYGIEGYPVRDTVWRGEELPPPVVATLRRGQEWDT